eukprot:735939-Pleurochrysis_carterae.AAC.1
MADILGFRFLGDGINEIGCISPWSAKFPLYKSVGVQHYRDISKLCEKPITERVTFLLDVADAAAHYDGWGGRQARRSDGGHFVGRFASSPAGFQKEV